LLLRGLKLLLRLVEALTEIFDALLCPGHVRSEVEPPADFAVYVHRVLHVLAGNLAPIEFADERAQLRVELLPDVFPVR